MLRFRLRPENPMEPKLKVMYRFLRVNESDMSFRILVRMPCCGAKWQVAHLPPEFTTGGRCMTCSAEIQEDPRQATFWQAKDMLHAAGGRVTRYVS